MFTLPVFEKVNFFPGSSICVEDNVVPYFISQWHYHPEVEILLVMNGTGNLYAGNSLHRFSRGDMALIGGGMPHVWLNDKEYYQGVPGRVAHSRVIKFNLDFWGEDFANLPEMKGIVDLLHKCARGLFFHEEFSRHTNELVGRVVESDGMARCINLLELLQQLSVSRSHEYLSSPIPGQSLDEGEIQRIDRVYRYLLDNFTREISLKEIADVAHMNPSAFCRYFRSRSLKTFTAFLNDVRVNYAARLLAETVDPVSDICYRSGFNYLSNFYKQFERVKKMSPGEYRRAIRRE